MDTIRSLTVMAALGLVSVAQAQVTPTPKQPESSCQSSSSTRSTDQSTGSSRSSNAPQSSTSASSSAHAEHQLVGAQIVTSGGQSLGTIKETIMGAAPGLPSYVVVTLNDGSTTVVPQQTVTSMMRDNKIVMDQSRLSMSPKVQQNALKDKTNLTWKSEADRYWTPGAIRSARPGAEADRTGTESSSNSSSPTTRSEPDASSENANQGKTPNGVGSGNERGSGTSSPSTGSGGSTEPSRPRNY